MSVITTADQLNAILNQMQGNRLVITLGNDPAEKLVAGHARQYVDAGFAQADAWVQHPDAPAGGASFRQIIQATLGEWSPADANSLIVEYAADGDGTVIKAKYWPVGTTYATWETWANAESGLSAG